MRTDLGLEPRLLHLNQVLKRGEDGHVIRRDTDSRFYEAENFRISSAGIGYFRPIFGDIPRDHTASSLDRMTIG